MRPRGTLAVVGATGQVGGVVLSILGERDLEFERVRLLASERSAGREIEFLGAKVMVEDVATADLGGIDYAIFSIGASASREYSPRFADAGAVVIDNSSAFRMDPRVPLVVPEVNPDDATEASIGIIANPNCTTMIAMPPLSLLDRMYGLRRVVTSTYQAASGAGRDGVTELAEQLDLPNLSALTFDGKAITFPPGRKFPAPLAGNVIPLAGSLVGEDTTEEEKFINESRKILGIPDLLVQVTCVRVPVFTGHSLSIVAECERTPDPAEFKKELAGQPGCLLADLPTPIGSSGIDPVLIGRVRRDTSSADGVAFFVSGDNLRKGAALNAIQILELVSSGQDGE